MDDNIIIARLLEKITKDYNGGYFELSSLIRMVMETKEPNYALRQRIKERIKVEKIADLLHNDSGIAPNKKTNEIIQKGGGYLSYIEAKEKEEKKASEHEDIRYKMDKWLYCTRYLPHFLSIISIIISIIALYRTLCP
jgi:hypothetical protein